MIHAERLETIGAEAKALEAERKFREARERWLAALNLLPENSKQAVWIGAHASELEEAALVAENEEPRHEWTKKLGPLAPIALVLAKSKSLLALLNLKFLLSLGAFMGFYWSEYGLAFGAGFAVLVLIHEMGHFIDVRRRKLPADMPVFLPGLGAYVRWQALGVSLETRAAVSLAGPLAGWASSAVCLALWVATGNTMWAALARAGAWLNVLNLIPVWVLDGGQAALALGRFARIALLTMSLALWLFLGESVFVLVAFGAIWRLFRKDMPTKPSRSLAAYYLLVLIALAVTMWLVPGHGFAAK